LLVNAVLETGLPVNTFLVVKCGWLCRMSVKRGVEEEKAVEATNAATVGLLGGELCLDFANTVEPRHTDNRRDYLTGYPDLVRWAEHAGALNEEEARRLLRVAEAHPLEAASTFERAVVLRETIYRVFSAVAYGEPPGASDLEALSAAHLEALAHYRIVRTAGGFAWKLAEGDVLGRPVWQVSLSATTLLTGGELDRVKACPSAESGCGWVFYDTSKNKSRRWCSMEGCGSRAKMRRMYARRRETGSGRES
jgi:predicted RNA-binding Zn ribbon-like protein